mmetsp:Transcript_2524/g.4577  ORF Transcript_2524/g.4577 Transcript_2524/m.4577 type:complete len:155 (+) Transcript_2524:115-579(+)
MSTAKIKQAYREKQRLQLAPIETSPIKSKSRNKTKPVKAVAYCSDIVNLPAVKMTGQPSIKSKYSATRRFHAGDLCSPAQQRLSQVDTFTGAYRVRFEGTDKRFQDYEGDYAKNPREASKLLVNKSNAELTIPGHAADFRTEVTWRLQLRPNLR